MSILTKYNSSTSFSYCWLGSSSCSSSSKSGSGGSITTFGGDEYGLVLLLGTFKACSDTKQPTILLNGNHDLVCDTRNHETQLVVLLIMIRHHNWLVLLMILHTLLSLSPFILEFVKKSTPFQTLISSIFVRTGHHPRSYWVNTKLIIL